MTQDISVLFLNMSEAEPEITTATVKERAVVFVERYLERVATQFGYGKVQNQSLANVDDTLFIVVGGIRSQPTPHDIGDSEAQVKQLVIDLLAEDGAIGDYGLATEFFASLGVQMYGNNPLRNYFSREFLEQHIQTETEVRHQLAAAEASNELLQHDSITTAANLDIILELIKRAEQVEALEFVSSPEHLFRIEALWLSLIKQVAEAETTTSLVERLKSLAVKLTGEAEYITLEFRTTARRLRDMVTELLARPFLEVDKRAGTNLYGLLEGGVSASRKDLNK
jgi:hypothetical protein